MHPQYVGRVSRTVHIFLKHHKTQTTNADMVLIHAHTLPSVLQPTMSTIEMYRNMPATPEKIQTLALWMLPMATPISMPMKARMEETQLYTMACFTVIPARSNTAKSPTTQRIFITIFIIMLLKQGFSINKWQTNWEPLKEQWRGKR